MTYDDLTILYYTSNTISEYFMKNTQETLLKAVGDTPIVSVSFKPTVVGNNCTNIVIGDGERSAYKIYQQVLIAAREAKTEFCVTAEDDLLYHPSHFEYRPEGDKFAYDVNKWSLFTWTEPPFFSYRERNTMTSLIVRRDALLKTLEERYQKYSYYDKEEFEKLKPYWGEPGRFENYLGLTGVEKIQYKSRLPSIVFSTPEALAYEHLGKRKAHAKKRQENINPWGSARHVLKYYKK